MVLMNNKMRDEIIAINLNGRSMPKRLANILSHGFLEEEGCFFLASLKKKSGNVTLKRCHDHTGYECFVNSIHIDDYVNGDYLVYAFLFVEKCFNYWNKLGRDEVLNAVISKNRFGSVVKIHLVREGQSWLSNDIEGYREEAILSIHSSEYLRCLLL